MFIKDHFSLKTIGLAIALSWMGGCAAPVEDQEPAPAPASEPAAQEETGEVSSAMWGAPIAAPIAPFGFGACGAGVGVAPAVGFAGPVGVGWGGLGWGGLGLGGLGLGGLGWGCGAGFAPAIGFRGEEASEEGTAKE